MLKYNVSACIFDIMFFNIGFPVFFDIEILKEVQEVT